VAVDPASVKVATNDVSTLVITLVLTGAEVVVLVNYTADVVLGVVDATRVVVVAGRGTEQKSVNCAKPVGGSARKSRALKH
jgi:hypothetical protein